MYHTLRTLACVGGFMVAGLVPAAADIVIIGSNSVQLKPGTVLTGSETLDIQKGAKVRIMTPSGMTRLLEGPLSAKAGDYANDSKTDTALWNAVTARLNPEAEEDTEPFTRGLAASSDPSPHIRFSWRSVPIDASGEICVEKGTAISLARALGEGSADVTVIDMSGGGRRAKVTMPAGQKTVPWPQDIALRSGNYALQIAGGTPQQFRLRLISDLPPPDEAIRVLHGQRCETQRDSLLEDLRDPAFDLAALAR